MPQPTNAFSKIGLALDETLDAATDLPISWTNLDFFPPAGPYLRATYLPGPVSQQLGEGGLIRHSGTYVVMAYGKPNEGEIPMMNIAGEIAAAFARGTIIARQGVVVVISSPPSIAGALREPDWIGVPVTIRWYSDNPA